MYAALIRLAFITFTIIIISSCAAGFGLTAGRIGGGSLIRVNSDTTTTTNFEVFTFKVGNR